MANKDFQLSGIGSVLEAVLLRVTYVFKNIFIGPRNGCPSAFVVLLVRPPGTVVPDGLLFYP